jgi:putative metalloenzyme radical SAM/SPASM domain maturase
MQPNTLAESAPHPAFGEYPSKLFVETTSRCNLNCFMCVKQTAAGGVAEGDLAVATFERLSGALPHLEALVLNGVGEPLLHPRLEDFIRLAKQRMPASGWVGFQTNGVLLSRQRARTLVEAGLDRVGLSLDGVTPETFRRVREGGELAAVERAMAALAEAGRDCGRSDLRVGVEFVLMRDNLHELPEALRWAAQRGATFAIVTHMLPYAAAHAGHAAYEPCSDAALDLYQTWQQRAAREGVDMKGYFKALWHFARNPEQRRIVTFVEAMKSAAEARGIVLDLRKLFAADPGRRAEVRQVLDEAQKVAAETGLELRLPAEMPRQERRCDFVEEGSAFVSWDGDVHPCYFLWHRYRCFAGGWEQQVEPRVFGNLNQRSLAEIWSDAPFRAFREGVLGYHHSPCSSCSVAPCDYVQTGRFEQDCHLQEQQCGSCLWCTGLFQCLS